MSYDYCTLWVLGLIRLDRTGGHTHFSESETELFGNKLERIFKAPLALARSLLGIAFVCCVVVVVVVVCRS